MLLSIVVNYICGLFASAQHTRPVRLAGMMSAIIIGIGLLGYFKYAGFCGDHKLDGGNGAGSGDHSAYRHIFFIRFRGWSYVIDVYRNDARVQRNPFKIALYIALFPQLVAGLSCGIRRWRRKSPSAGRVSRRFPRGSSGFCSVWRKK